MPYFEKKITSGNMVEVFRYQASMGGRSPRSPKNSPTTQEMEKVNEKNARLKLARLINANFNEDDLFVTLTYKEEPRDAKAALLEQQKFLRRVRLYRRRMGLSELKYIAVIECKDTRLHHHILMNDIDPRVLFNLWGHGKVINSNLQPDENAAYAKLAGYILKDTESEDSENWPMSRRWTRSRNLVQPVEEITEIRSISSKVPKEVEAVRKKHPGYEDLRILEYSSGNGEFGPYQYVRMIREPLPPTKRRYQS